MRKLTVKNFSVIKDATLVFGKITVLIGPQSSGKSLLCKLAYFLSKHVVENAADAILSYDPSRLNRFEEFKTSLTRDFLEWFPYTTWANEDCFVRFESKSYSIQVFPVPRLGGIDATFSAEFENLFNSLIEDVGQFIQNSADSKMYLTEQVRAKLNLLQTEDFICRSAYFPDGRGIFTNQSLGYSFFNNPDIEPVIREFALEVSWGSSRTPDSILGEEGVRVLNEINNKILQIAGGHVEGRNGSAHFRRAFDSRLIPLTLLSSGTQTMLSMFHVLWQIITEQRRRMLFPRPDSLPGMPNHPTESKALIYIEEPEVNVFPDTQYALVRLFAWLSHEWRLDFSWVITTHSPYILSSFNSLIMAGQLATERPDLKDEIEQLVPQRYWIRGGDFRAYRMCDGELKPILSASGLIDGEFLDSVSETIGDEFDSLLRLEYDRTEAS
jgi:energy-coupling factor transporter ATP-binding protein EcfA2